MGSPWSVLGHLLHAQSSLSPHPGLLCPEHQCRGAHGDLLTLIYVLTSTWSFQLTATWQDSGKWHLPWCIDTLGTAEALHVPLHHSLGSRWDQSHIVRPPSKTPPHPPQAFSDCQEQPQVLPKLQHFPALPFAICSPHPPLPAAHSKASKQVWTTHSAISEILEAGGTAYL